MPARAGATASREARDEPDAALDSARRRAAPFLTRSLTPAAVCQTRLRPVRPAPFRVQEPATTDGVTEPSMSTHPHLAAEGGYQDFELHGRRVVLADLLGRHRASRDRGRLRPDAGRARRRPGHAEDDRDRQGDPGGRDGLPAAPVPDDRRHPRAGRRSSCSSPRPRSSSRTASTALSLRRVGLCPHARLHRRLRPVRAHRLHRHEPGGARQRAHRRRGHERARCRPRSRSRSAPAASPACSPSASACSAPPSSS